MKDKTFELIAGAIFSLISLGHLTRIVRGVDFRFGEWAAPMWISWVALVVMGFLAYQGFRLARESR